MTNTQIIYALFVIHVIRDEKIVQLRDIILSSKINCSILAGIAARSKNNGVCRWKSPSPRK